MHNRLRPIPTKAKLDSNTVALALTHTRYLSTEQN